jgi:hypothetical protein
MLLPDKHIKISESILGFGSFVLEYLSRSRTVDEIWEKYQNAKKSETYPSSHSFSNLILCLCFLYSIGTIQLNNDGKVEKCV